MVVESTEVSLYYSAVQKAINFEKFYVTIMSILVKVSVTKPFMIVLEKYQILIPFV